MIPFRFLFLFIFVISTPLLYSATPLTLSEVLQIVREKYPVIESAKKDFEVAQGRLRESEGAFDIQWKTKAGSALMGYYQNRTVESFLEQPTQIWGTSFLAGYRLGLGEFPIYEGKQETNPGGELVAGLSIPLWRDGPIDGRRANIQKSELGISVADLEVKQQRINSVLLATHRYWDWVAASLKLKIFRELLKIAEERDKGLSDQVKLGDLPEFERRDNLRAILQRRSQVIGAERALQQASIALSLFYRDEQGEPLIVSEDRAQGDIPGPSPSQEPSEGLEVALERRPDLKRIEFLKSQNEVDRKFASNQVTPRVNLQLQGVRSLRQGDPTRNESELEASVLLEIPLQANMAGGREDSAIAAAMRFEVQERFLRDRIKTEFQDAHSALQAAALRADLTRRETELAKQLEKGERVRFKQGASNQLIVNIREQATADAAVREIDSLSDYQKSLAILSAVLGNS